ncbi:MAG TPA: SDR family oxidoreductase [Candidatus Omnitrophota bacterium]|nr:SDR family oxidoreductase [Candidatus Omnitrophota bacterium]HPD84556.1 SDR family oxidoreductase [Candidatus Omnitrophota bacterium]HRZ03414.1 SDR family oxidoreductase [Candidatus Omnitrophota bacterium]
MNETEKLLELKYSDEQIQECIALLQSFVENSEQLAHLTKEQRIALINAAGRLSRPDRNEIRKRNRDCKRVEKKKIINYERRVRAETGIRSAREATVFTAPAQVSHRGLDSRQERPELISPRNCYICKAEFTRVHFFYDAMCPACAEFNYQKRFQTAPLTGQVALITGSRLKIGYQATLMMLRAGAKVIATTRFPVDSALRYSRESDFDQWKNQLHIYGLDLRHTPSVEIFCNFIEHQYDRLDLLINNAAQTVRRPPGFYAHLMENENKRYEDLPENVQMLLRPFKECKEKILAVSHNAPGTDLTLPVTWNGKAPGIGIFASAKLSQVPYAYDHTLPAEKVFPKGEVDADLQQVDLREMNSWRLRLGDIPTAEMLELQLVNSIAPFVLCNRLSVMMKRQNTGKKHIVNVSAMEGKFQRFVKTDRHPHTNMAKAALNMLTHTSASDLAKSGIFMNSVDTGWVTDEDPLILSKRKQQMHDFQPPLDIVDGAARVCDPFFDGILTGKHWCGKFLKDYFPIAW